MNIGTNTRVGQNTYIYRLAGVRIEGGYIDYNIENTCFYTVH